MAPGYPFTNFRREIGEWITGCHFFLDRSQQSAFHHGFGDLLLELCRRRKRFDVRDSGLTGCFGSLFVNLLPLDRGFRLYRTVGLGRYRIQADAGLRSSDHNGAVDNREVDRFPESELDKRALRARRRSRYLDLLYESSAASTVLPGFPT